MMLWFEGANIPIEKDRQCDIAVRSCLKSRGLS